MSGTVREVALRAAVTALPETPICEGEQRLISGDVQEIHIVDEQERLLGRVPDVEFLNYRLLGGDGLGRIASLLVPVEMIFTLETTLQQAALVFKDSRHSAIPVLQGGRLLGVLSRRSLLRLLTDEGIPQSATNPLTGSPAIPPPKFSYLTQPAATIRMFDGESTFPL